MKSTKTESGLERSGLTGFIFAHHSPASNEPGQELTEAGPRQKPRREGAASWPAALIHSFVCRLWVLKAWIRGRVSGDSLFPVLYAYMVVTRIPTL